MQSRKAGCWQECFALPIRSARSPKRTLLIAQPTVKIAMIMPLCQPRFVASPLWRKSDNAGEMKAFPQMTNSR